MIAVRMIFLSFKNYSQSSQYKGHVIFIALLSIVMVEMNGVSLFALCSLIHTISANRMAPTNNTQ